MELVKTLGGDWTIQLFEDENALLIHCVRKVNEWYEDPEFEDVNFIIPKKIPKKKSEQRKVELRIAVDEELLKMMKKLEIWQLHKLIHSPCYKLFLYSVKFEIYEEYLRKCLKRRRG